MQLIKENIKLLNYYYKMDLILMTLMNLVKQFYLKLLKEKIIKFENICIRIEHH